jgi:hypothetical protein
MVNSISDSLGGLADKFNSMTGEQQQTLVKTLALVAALGPLLFILGQLTIVLGGIATLIATIGVLAFGLGIIAVLIGGAVFATRNLNHELSKTPSLARGGFESFETENLKDLAGGVKSVGTEMGRAATSARLTGLAAHYAAGGFDIMARASEDVAESTSEAAAGVDDLGGKTAASGPKVIRLTAAMQDMLKGLNQTHAAAGDSGAAIAQFSREMLAAGNITDATARGAEKLAQAIRGNLDRALADGNRLLDEARQKFEKYRDAIAGGITRGNTLADAVAAQDEAIRDLADAQDAYNKAVEGGDEEEIARTAKALDDAKAARRDFIDFLGLGAETAEGFADQIEALRLAGASLEVIEQIARLGAKTGGRVIAELLAGGSEAITQANSLVDAVESAAARAGQGAAEQFFGAGVRSAKQFVRAIEATIPELQSVLDRIADMIEKSLGVRPNVDLTGREKTFIDPTSPGAPTPVPGPTPVITVPRGGFDAPGVRMGDEFVALAAGGLVTSPTFAMIGEAGPELVIPLDRLGGMGGDTYVINVSGALDAEGTARTILRTLRDAERRTGERLNV